MESVGRENNIPHYSSVYEKCPLKIMKHDLSISLFTSPSSLFIHGKRENEGENGVT